MTHIPLGLICDSDRIERTAAMTRGGVACLGCFEPIELCAGSTFMLPKQALHSSIYAASSPEEVDIIDPSAMSNTPSPTGKLPHRQISPSCHRICQRLSVNAAE